MRMSDVPLHKSAKYYNPNRHLALEAALKRKHDLLRGYMMDGRVSGLNAVMLEKSIQREERELGL